MEKENMTQGKVENLTHDGRGIIRQGHYPVFVPGALPGETIDYQLVKEGKKFATGKLVKILEKSPFRQEKKDPKLDPIMSLQALNYGAQLAFKEDVVNQALKRIGGFEGIKSDPILAMEDPWAYRNKMTLAVEDYEGKLEFGIYQRGSHDFIPINRTYLAEGPLDKAIFTLRDCLRDHEIKGYNPNYKTGNLHHIVVKRGHYKGQVMVVFITRTKDQLGSKALYHDLEKKLIGLKTLVQNIQPKVHQEILGRQSKILWGDGKIQDQMLGLDFIQTPQSFYQVNTPQAERLYKIALDWANLTGKEEVLDAYCGLGTISLNLARKAKKVYAMEIVEEAIKGAKENAKINGLDNLHFEAGPADKVLKTWKKQGIHFDLAVVDPPRKGLDADFIKNLGQIGSKRIVYVSCNPASLARDCKLFKEEGYRLERVQAVDMFPNTPHVESVVLMSRK